MDPFTATLLLGSLGAAGGIAGGFMQNSAQRSANDANRDLAREQMQFQERMSSTAHQREVSDLRAAGLNPVLSAGGGGSSTPSGASAVIGSQTGVSSSVSGMPLMLAQLAQSNAQTSKLKSERKLTEAMIPGAKSDSAVKSSLVPRAEILGGFWDSTRRTLGLSPENLRDYRDWHERKNLPALRQRRND